MDSFYCLIIINYVKSTQISFTRLTSKAVRIALTSFSFPTLPVTNVRALDILNSYNTHNKCQKQFNDNYSNMQSTVRHDHEQQLGLN